MLKELLWLGGVYHLCFAAFHLSFWRLFRWDEQLARLSSLNRGVMQVLNLCLTYAFVMCALMSFCYADALTHSGEGRAVLAGVAGFWALRAVQQLVFFRLRAGVQWSLFSVFAAGAGLYGYAFAAAPG
ncbi:hypothetical protein [Niveibacterium sp. SC-1]|uniref:hypothetical protein n=1 Tax=Niveibacterium sp. SC-1 TaxID=3135646 RepID=UPI00311F96E0